VVQRRQEHGFEGENKTQIQGLIIIVPHDGHDWGVNLPPISETPVSAGWWLTYPSEK